ncbi:unnamed protein product [Oncorhynchus mykiss]|uniref:Uncharacterized protein n=1 Tax=Oncorhynchus mykiss TaxID=8022 RepID=A0A060XAG1_ONCMY|nr:unnamed protein product [Oncorhynchus mykiss]
MEASALYTGIILSVACVPPLGGRLCVSDGQGQCCACGHVWQITEQDYSCAAVNGQKSLTDKVCCEIGEFFRQPWGPYAR